MSEMPSHFEDPESNLVDRLSGQPEGPQSAAAEPRTAEQQPESASELAAIREENERLGARLKTLEAGSRCNPVGAGLPPGPARSSAATTLASDRNTNRTARNTRNCGTRSPRSVTPWEVYRPPRSWPSVMSASRWATRIKGCASRCRARGPSCLRVLGLPGSSRIARKRSAWPVPQAEELNQRIEQLDGRLNGVHGELDQLGEQLGASPGSAQQYGCPARWTQRANCPSRPGPGCFACAERRACRATPSARPRTCHQAR